jgi:4-deoxy-L-threo-5-hexosulose-uronate ketol-isomerase
MQVKVLQATHPDMIIGLSTEKLRNYYLLTDLFAADDIRLSYSHVERLIAGGATPAHKPLELEAVKEAARIPSSPAASWESSTLADPARSLWTGGRIR